MTWGNTRCHCVFVSRNPGRRILVSQKSNVWDTKQVLTLLGGQEGCRLNISLPNLCIRKSNGCILGHKHTGYRTWVRLWAHERPCSVKLFNWHWALPGPNWQQSTLPALFRVAGTIHTGRHPNPLRHQHLAPVAASTAWSKHCDDCVCEISRARWPRPT